MAGSRGEQHETIDVESIELMGIGAIDHHCRLNLTLGDERAALSNRTLTQLSVTPCPCFMLYAFMAYETYEVRSFVYAISPAQLTILIRILYLWYLLFTVNYSLHLSSKLIQATWYSYHGKFRPRNPESRQQRNVRAFTGARAFGHI